MSKGVKKCIGFLTLFVLVAPFFLISSDVNATRHDYDSIFVGSHRLPYGNGTGIKWDSSLNQNVFDWSVSNTNIYEGDAGFVVGVQGDAWTLSNLSNDDIAPVRSASVIYCMNNPQDNSKCWINSDPKSQFSRSSLQNVPGFAYRYNMDTGIIPDFAPSGWNLDSSGSTNYYFRFKRLGDASSQNQIVDLGQINSLSTMSCYQFINGAMCPGLWNTRNYIETQILPYWYSYDGFYVNDTAINPENGFSYDNSFSLNQMYNYDFPYISSLRIPLSAKNDFFSNPNELYKGRALEFRGTFEFDHGMTWNPALSDGHSNSFVRVVAVSKTNRTTPRQDFYVSCQWKTTVLENKTVVSYSCPFNLTDDYIFLSPYLYVSGGSEDCNDNDYCYRWLWHINIEESSVSSTSQWRFGFSYIVTDNDDTPGEHWNTEVTGGGELPFGSAEERFSQGNPSFIDSLSKLFSFSMINPFAPIFALFTDSNTCASIPILAGMIHSNETQVCPWFDSTTRNIVTPVLGLSAMMLVFGFAVRWLGSRSGNFIEDSGGVDSGGLHFQNKFRRKS